MTSPRLGRVGLAAVAKEASVSIATVSNTLNHPDVVSEATRARVLAVIERLDFVPNTAAASLRRGSNRLIGLVVPDITNPFYAGIARGVSEASDLHRYGVILCNSRDDAERELSQLQLLAEHRAAGALVVPLTADHSRLARLRSLGTHLVLIDQEADEGCAALMDDVLGGRIAVEHLLDTRGHQIAVVNGHHSIVQCADRWTGAREAFTRAGADPSMLTEIQVTDMTIEAGENAVPDLLAGGAPAGIFCTNDQLAIGVARGLLARGIDVPTSTAVVGYGDLFGADAPIPLTTVEQPKDALGRAAVELLMQELREGDGLHRHSSTVFRPNLVIRQSAPDSSSRSMSPRKDPVHVA
jgi:LacI family transcriptional regulator